MRTNEKKKFSQLEPTQIWGQPIHANVQIHNHSLKPFDVYEWNRQDFQPKEEVQQNLLHSTHSKLDSKIHKIISLNTMWLSTFTYQAFLLIVLYRNQLNFHLLISQGGKTTQEPEIWNTKRILIENKMIKQKWVRTSRCMEGNLIEEIRENFGELNNVVLLRHKSKKPYQFFHITHILKNSIPGSSNIRKHSICMIKFSSL